MRSSTDPAVPADSAPPGTATDPRHARSLSRPGLDPAAILMRAVDIAAPPGSGVATFWELWLAHRDDLRRQSLRLLSGNFAEAEDALSEAMLKAVQAFPGAEIRNPRAWLLRLVHNSCIDHYREHRRREQAMQPHKRDDGQSLPAAGPKRARTPEDLVAAMQEIGDLDRALRALPQLLAQPLRLHLDDVPDEQIAARLGITREVVRKRRQMARAWLRRRIA